MRASAFRPPVARATGKVWAAALIGAIVAAMTPAPPANAEIWTEPYFAYTNAASGRCLDAAAQGGGEDGTPVQLWDCYPPSQANQLWQMRPVLYLPHGAGVLYNIVSGTSGHRCLDAKDWGTGNETPIQLWNCGQKQLNQLWEVYQRTPGGPFVIRNPASGRILDAAAQWNGANGTPIQLWDNLGEGQTNQRWHQEYWGGVPS